MKEYVMLGEFIASIFNWLIAYYENNFWHIVFWFLVIMLVLAVVDAIKNKGEFCVVDLLVAAALLAVPIVNVIVFIILLHSFLPSPRPVFSIAAKVVKPILNFNLGKFIAQLFSRGQS